jgi:hypothetical protein
VAHAPGEPLEAIEVPPDIVSRLASVAGPAS